MKPKPNRTLCLQVASEKCIAHPKVQDLLGEPIKAFGEETRRGRRRHVRWDSRIRAMLELDLKNIFVTLIYEFPVYQKMQHQVDRKQIDPKIIL